MPQILEQGDWIDLTLAEDVRFKAPQANKMHRRKDKNKGISQEERVRDVDFYYYIAKLGIAAKIPEGFQAGALDFASSLFGWVIYQGVDSLAYIGAGILTIITVAMVVWNRMRIQKEEHNK